MLVLIVEDIEMMQQTMKLVVERVGRQQAIITGNGLGAIELVESNADIKLVLLDVQMPDMSGIETLRRIRDIRPDLPVVIVSAYVTEKYIEEARLAGATGYVAKDSMMYVAEPLLQLNFAQVSAMTHLSRGTWIFTGEEMAK